MAEKKFHDNAVRDAMGKANAAWVEERRNRVEEEVRQFYVRLTFTYRVVDLNDRASVVLMWCLN